MRFGTAIERLVDNYQYAKSKVWIRDEVAWALYHTWKEADDRKTEPQNYCDDCLYTDTCDSKEFFYACTSKATISKMEQVEDEPQTDCAWK